MAPTSSTSTRRTSIRRRAASCRPTSCGPIVDTAPSAIRQNTGETDYNSLQVQLNRRYIKGFQFAARLHAGQGLRQARHQPVRPGGPGLVLARADRRHAAAQPDHQLHLGCAGRQQVVEQRLTRGALDGWQLSGNTAFVSGDWAGVTFSTTDNFDFYGGGAGGRIVLTGVDPRSGDNRDPNPDGTGSYLNWAAFARPSGRLDLGNAPARFFRLPWIRNTDLSMFKNFQMGGGRRIQIRWEIYNLFNTVNWSGIDTSAQFNPAGRAGATCSSARRRRRATRASCRARSASPSSRSSAHVATRPARAGRVECRVGPAAVGNARRPRHETLPSQQVTARSNRAACASVLLLCAGAARRRVACGAPQRRRGPRPRTQDSRTVRVTVVSDRTRRCRT